MKTTHTHTHTRKNKTKDNKTKQKKKKIHPLPPPPLPPGQPSPAPCPSQLYTNATENPAGRTIRRRSVSTRFKPPSPCLCLPVRPFVSRGGPSVANLYSRVEFSVYSINHNEGRNCIYMEGRGWKK